VARRSTSISAMNAENACDQPAISVRRIAALVPVTSSPSKVLSWAKPIGSGTKSSDRRAHR